MNDEIAFDAIADEFGRAGLLAIRLDTGWPPIGPRTTLEVRATVLVPPDRKSVLSRERGVAEMVPARPREVGLLAMVGADEVLACADEAALARLVVGRMLEGSGLAGDGR